MNSTDILVWMLAWAIAGYVTATVLLAFFDEEIFRFFDRMRAFVRKLLGLEK